MTSKEFKINESDQEMSIQYLLLLGVLYCSGSNEEKSRVFYDILQDGLQDSISANDKDIKSCFGRLIEMPTANLHRWCSDFGDPDMLFGTIEEFNKDKYKRQWKEVIEAIQEKFLDDVFDVNSKIPREDFIKLVAQK
jgi:hypothetical protein